MAKAKKQVNVRLAEIQESAFYFVEPSPDVVENLGDHLDITINTSVGHSEDLTRIIVRIDVSLIHKETEKEEDHSILVNGEILIIFEAEGWVSDKKKPLIPHNIALTLVGTTYSTLRGILFARCGGSIMRNFPLPIMYPEKLIRNIDGVEKPPKENHILTLGDTDAE